MDAHLTGKRWFRLALLNLTVVALYGSLMRYKIAFDFPFFEQKNLLHAHSHFAFSGWIGHVLYSGLALIMAPFVTVARQKVYKWIIFINLFCAYGMLLAFTAQGYAILSIIFSTLSILVAVIYGVFFIKDSSHLPQNAAAKPWAIMGLLLNILSCAGPLVLAYMLASGHIDHHYYLGSIYYYLHFQYNGWFFFAGMALLVSMFNLPAAELKNYFLLFTFCAIPTFFLSILWAKLPSWLYIITVLASLLQLVAWFFLLKKLYHLFLHTIVAGYPRWIKFLFLAGAAALSLKFVLQAISVIPFLSQLVFGIRAIVIAYLHLVLLGVYSLFIIGYSFAKGYIHMNGKAKIAAILFFTGVVLNEMLLGTQGFAAFFYYPVKYINELLLVAALILWGSSLLLLFSQVGKSRKLSL